MFIRKNLWNGVEVAIIVRGDAEDRLARKCFRGTSLKLAGNFSRWHSAQDLFQDPVVLEQFLDDIHGLWVKEDFATHSFTAVHPEMVGWESTAPLENYKAEDLEQFDLNRRSWGLRVKSSCTNLFAPQTNEITLVFEFKIEGSKPVAVVHSIYPGRDMGELYGDMTDREKRVFFDWNHPGV